MFTAVIGMILMAGGIHGSPKANKYFDTLLNTSLHTEVINSQLDPASLTDLKVEFREHFEPLGDIVATANFTNGKLTGLSNARPAGECLKFHNSVRNKTLSCNITFDNLKVEYDAKVNFADIPNKISKVKMDVNSSLIQVEVEIRDRKTSAVEALLFELNLGDVNYVFIGPMKYIKTDFFEYLSHKFKTHVEEQISGSITQTYKDALSRAVKSKLLPKI